VVLWDTFRVLTGTAVLGFAAACDLKWRRAPDASWLVMIAVGAILLVGQAATEPAFLSRNLPPLLASAMIFGAALLGYVTGLLTGGADAKALASLAVLAPLPLDVAWQTPLPSSLPLVLTALTNGLVLGLAVPVVLTLTNLLRGDVDGARTVLATRVPVDQVEERIVWPLEYVSEEGEVVTEYTPGRVPLDAFDADALAERGREQVWVTPKIPFLVPLFVGFVLAALVGDPVATLLRLFVV